MTESSLIQLLIDKLGTAGILLAAVWLVARRLAEQYESRIAAVEEACKECEQDRTWLRNMFFTHLGAKGPITQTLRQPHQDQ